jgi:hypothetical protein
MYVCRPMYACMYPSLVKAFMLDVVSRLENFRCHHHSSTDSEQFKRVMLFVDSTVLIQDSKTV